MEGNRETPDYLGIPTTVYSIPALAAVGLGEEQARKQGLKFKVNRGTSSNWYSSRRIGESDSGFKVLIEEGTGRILGAHLLGVQAGEIINFFALAIRKGISAGELKSAIFTYPTHASDLPYML